MSTLATCAGFPADVLPAIAACGTGVELGDHVPFAESFGARDRSILAVLVATALRLGDRVPLAVEEMFGPPIPRGAAVARSLAPAAVSALAAFDDLRLARLWNASWQALGATGAVPADLTQAIRGLVVQCRAAVSNGWEVFVVEGA